MADRNNNPASSIPYHMREEETKTLLSEDDQKVVDIIKEVFEEHQLKEHRFWRTQPVMQLADPYIEMIQGPIEPTLQAKQEPCNLNSKFEWVTCDLNSDETLTKVQKFLNGNYTADDADIKFPNEYSKDFLLWCLCPPKNVKNWYIGVQAKQSKVLVGFIAGIPAGLWLNSTFKNIAEIKFMCVHTKLRSNGVAQALMKEMQRRVVLEGIFQGAYTTSAHVPTPIASCQYWYKLLNPIKLLKIGFSTPGGRKLTKAQAANVPQLPHSTKTRGFHQMIKVDVPGVTELLRNHLNEYIEPDFDENAVEHWFLPRDSVVNSFVVKDENTSQVTDFCSFYILTSVIPRNKKYPTLKSGYLFYHAETKTAQDKLMEDVLVVAKQKGCDVFYCLNVMKNELFLKKLKFKPIEERSLYYYLYNYRLNKPLKPTDIGLVLV